MNQAEAIADNEKPMATLSVPERDIPLIKMALDRLFWEVHHRLAHLADKTSLNRLQISDATRHIEKGKLERDMQRIIDLSRSIP